MNTFILILIIVVAILNIMLFFKIWGMTNNIKILTNFYMLEKGIKVNGMAKNLNEQYQDKDGNNIRIF